MKHNLCRCLAALLLALPIALVIGCASSGLSPVAGQVTVNKEPLAEGTIDFLAAGGDTPTAAAPIASGQYTCQVPPGSKKVIIRGYKVVGQERASRLDPNSPIIDKKEQFLPPRYSDEAQTELKADITSSGNRALNFELTAP